MTVIRDHLDGETLVEEVRYPEEEPMTDREALAEALYDAIGWGGSFRYHPEDEKGTGDFSTYRAIPAGIVSGDPDHADWQAFVGRVLDALRSESPDSEPQCPGCKAAAGVLRAVLPSPDSEPGAGT